MAKIGIFKKVAALATAIAIVLCFAVSAGAADEISVTTLTSYVDDVAKDNILVEVTIQGEEIAGKSVSYYAYDSENSPVYIDQFEEDSEEIFFDYVTASANLNSDVKIGYTGASKAEDAKVEGNTVTWGDAVKHIPTEAEEATVTFVTEATAITSFNVVGAKFAADPTLANGVITVSLEEIAGAVTLTIETETEATVEFIDAGFVYCAGQNDTLNANATTSKNDKMLTVIGKAKGAAVYGVIVSADANVDEADKYQAIATSGNLNGMNASGYYAVQLIDDFSDYSVDGEFVYDFLTEDSYYVGAYADNTVAMYEEDGVVTPISIVDLR